MNLVSNNTRGAGDTASPDGEVVIASQNNSLPFWKKIGSYMNVVGVGSKYFLGIILILCVTVIWVGSSVWIQYIFGELEYDKPYFMTFFNTTGFSLWNLGFVLIPAWMEVPKDDRRREQPILVEDPNVYHDGWHEREERTREEDYLHAEGEYKANLYAPSATHALTTTRVRIYDGVDVYSDSSFCTGSSVEDFRDIPVANTYQRVRVERVRPYTLKKIWFAAALFCPFWFFANYLFNLSLSKTSVASNTILSSTSSIWTVLFSYLLLRQPVGILKWLGVALCFSGSVMVGVSDKSGQDSDSNHNTVWGNFAALISASLYAAYTSILKWQLPDDERYAMGMVFGAVGVINFLCLWPGLIFLNITGWETFVFPSVLQFWPMVLNSLIGTNLSDVLWARSVVLTSPVIATLGLSLTTPLAMIVDSIWSGSRYNGVYIAGSVLVVCGFIIANLPFTIDVRRFLRRNNTNTTTTTITTNNANNN